MSSGDSTPVAFGGPDRVVRGDEQDVAIRPAEGEVDGARETDLADQVAARVEDLHAAERRRVDAARSPSTLMPSGNPGCGDGEQALVDKMAALRDVEGLDVVRALNAVGPNLLVGATVGDVEDRLVGEKAKPLGLSNESATTERRSSPGS